MVSLTQWQPLIGIRQRMQVRYKNWIKRRLPRAKTLTLDQKRIFIFPSRAGFFFLLLLMLTLITAINYQNNMIFALTFLLANLFVIAVLHTFANLSGLTVHAVRATAVFAGQQSEFEIKLSRSGKRQHFAIVCQWDKAPAHSVNLSEDAEVAIKTYLDTGVRGWFRPGRMLIESYYPLGLIRTWTWVDLDIKALVYPRPVASEPMAGHSSDRPDGSAIPIPGSDDFYGLRDYSQGDSLKHVFWKSVAKGQRLQTKQYNAYADRSVWLDWQLFAGLPAEQRLSHLCYWLLEFESSKEDYGLRLPGITLEPGRGEVHKTLLLRKLALFGLTDEADGV